MDFDNYLDIQAVSRCQGKSDRTFNLAWVAPFFKTEMIKKR